MKTIVIGPGFDMHATIRTAREFNAIIVMEMLPDGFMHHEPVQMELKIQPGLDSTDYHLVIPPKQSRDQRSEKAMKPNYMKTKILSWLLHHSNRQTKLPAFYAIKDRLLKAYGTHVGYDVQHIEGKRCWTCNGTGIYPRWDQYGIYDPDYCWSCGGNGWYKDPQWNLLSRVRFGSYTFHSPVKRERRVKNPWTKEQLGWDPSQSPVIEGYIDHSSTRYGNFAIAMLFLLYDLKALRDLYKDFGAGYYHNWWSFKRFANNLTHVLRNGSKAIPFTRFRSKPKPPRTIIAIPTEAETELPF